MADGTQTPAVSVVVLAYNHAPYIRSALESVLRQETSFPIEVLIGEDDSQDGTREICTEIKEQHPDQVRLFLRRREDVIYINGRPTGRFNYVTTMKAARGRYLAYLDGDDEWRSPHKLQKQLDLMEAHPEFTLCFHPVVRTYVDSEKSDDTFYPPGREGPYGLGELLQQNVIQSCSVMYRQGYFTCIPNFILHTTVADWPAHLWHAIHGGVGYIDEAMGLYRVHDAGGGRHYRAPEASALSALSVPAVTSRLHGHTSTLCPLRSLLCRFEIENTFWGCGCVSTTLAWQS